MTKPNTAIAAVAPKYNTAIAAVAAKQRQQQTELRRFIMGLTADDCLRDKLFRAANIKPLVSKGKRPGR